MIIDQKRENRFSVRMHRDSKQLLKGIENQELELALSNAQRPYFTVINKHKLEWHPIDIEYRDVQFDKKCSILTEVSDYVQNGNVPFTITYTMFNNNKEDIECLKLTGCHFVSCIQSGCDYASDKILKVKVTISYENCEIV